MATEEGGLITFQGAMSASKAKMETLPLTRFVHENMATVITFAFSQKPIRRLIDEKFKGYWEYLEDFAFGVPERNATRACLEIAVLLRLIEEPPAYRKWSFGVIYGTDGNTKPLSLKELTNKIIHADELSWDLSDEKAPKLLCIAPDAQKEKHKWTKAEVDIVTLAAHCGTIMSSAGRL
jgi:hypothetical protein